MTKSSFKNFSDKNEQKIIYKVHEFNVVHTNVSINIIYVRT
jgi:hypothetical protein